MHLMSSQDFVNQDFGEFWRHGFEHDIYAHGEFKFYQTRLLLRDHQGYLELPDITTDPENKLDTQFSNASSLLRKDCRAKGLQNPFYYSMFVTPFSLLCPAILSKESVSLEDMITVRPTPLLF
jgi:hypothetical protein